MTNKFEQEFEEYLDGNSEISQLYSQSKTVNTPEDLSNTIKAMARENTSVTSTAPIGKKSQHKIFLPFAMAATVVLSVGVYWAVAPQSAKQHPSEIELAKLNNTVESAEPDIKRPAQQHPGNNVVISGQENNLKETSNKINTQIALSQQKLMTQEKSTKQPTDDTRVLDDDNQSSKTSSTNLIPGVKSISTNKLLAVDDAPNKKKASLENTTDDTDADFSMDWMDRLASRKPDTASVTKTLSSSLAPEKWVDEISLLHRQNKHQEAKKSLSEFRKLYPRYKLPAVLQEAYEPR